LSGLAVRQPLAAAAVAILVFSLAGIPPMAGFFAKYSVFYGTAMSGATGLVLVAIVASLIGVSYYFRMIYSAYKAPVEGESSAEISGTAYVLLILSALLTLALGLYPALFDRLLVA
jgi:NADH-quinone oxidoreductase subunit N